MYQAKDLYQAVGITKKQFDKLIENKVFIPENEVGSSKRRDYTDKDLENLKRIELLLKSGLTQTIVKDIQEEKISLLEACKKREKALNATIAKSKASLNLMEELLNSCIKFGTFDVDELWERVKENEEKGIQYLSGEDLENNVFELPFDKEFECPICGKRQKVDLEDYIVGDWSDKDESDNRMGPDYNVEFDSGEELECEKCGCKFHITGWMREYPIGAYDSEDINIHCIYECDL